MTPLELLEEVKGRFVVLYHDDEAALLRLLTQALRKYQDKAGVILSGRYPSGTSDAPFPECFLSVAACQDARQRHVCVTEDWENKRLVFDTQDATGELTLYWFSHLAAWPPKKNLPYGCVGLVGDYLEALIDIPNTSRARDAYHDINGPVSDLPSLAELKGRLAELELQMEECRAIIPPALVIC